MAYQLANDWLERARGARRMAEMLTDATTREYMIARAQAYERLAFRTEQDHAPANDA